MRARTSHFMDFVHNGTKMLGICYLQSYRGIIAVNYDEENHAFVSNSTILKIFLYACYHCCTFKKATVTLKEIKEMHPRAILKFTNSLKIL